MKKMRWLTVALSRNQVTPHIVRIALSLQALLLTHLVPRTVQVLAQALLLTHLAQAHLVYKNHIK